MAEGDGVDKLETGSGSHPGSQTGNFHAESGQFLGQIKSSRFPPGICAEAEDDFGDFVLLRALEESGKF